MHSIEETAPAEALSTALYTRFRSRQGHTFAENVCRRRRTLRRPHGAWTKLSCARSRPPCRPKEEFLPNALSWAASAPGGAGKPFGQRGFWEDNGEKLMFYAPGLALPNAKPATAERKNGIITSVNRQAIAMAGIVQEFSRIVQPAARTSGHRPFGRPMPRAHEQTDVAARLPPELAFLVAEGFPPERLLNALGSEPKAVRPVDKLLSEGLISEETYYRALARHLGCEYYNGEPPLAGAFDAMRGLRCGVAPLEIPRRRSTRGHCAQDAICGSNSSKQRNRAVFARGRSP